MSEEIAAVKGFLLPIIVGLVTISVVTLVIYPQVKQYLSDRQDIADMQHKADLMENKINDLQSIDTSQLDQNLAVAFTVLPKDASVPEAVLTLEQASTQSGVLLSELGYTASAQSVVDNYQVKAKVEGSLQGIDQFLTTVHNSPRVVLVNSLEVQVSGQNSTVSSADIPLAVYFRPTSNKIAKPDQPLSKLSNDDQQLLQKLSDEVASANSLLQSEQETSSVPLGKTNPFQ